MKRTKKNRQAECLQTGKSERTAANAAKCANGYGQEKTGSDFRKDEGRGKPLSVFLEGKHSINSPFHSKNVILLL